jgi:hypothetical protein
MTVSRRELFLWWNLIKQGSELGYIVPSRKSNELPSEYETSLDFSTTLVILLLI